VGGSRESIISAAGAVHLANEPVVGAGWSEASRLSIVYAVSWLASGSPDDLEREALAGIGASHMFLSTMGGVERAIVLDSVLPAAASSLPLAALALEHRSMRPSCFSSPS